MTDVIKSDAKAVRRRGRPPAFDRTTVLASAAKTFWQLGYEGASIVDLTAAMGITAQSLYAAFGSKPALYEEALGWYASGATMTQEALDAPNVIQTLIRLLNEEARRFADPKTPPGCMISTAVLGCAVENDHVASKVSSMREATCERIRARLERAMREGELSPDAEPTHIARFVGATIQGMSVQARDGADEAALAGIVAVAAQALTQAAANEHVAETPSRRVSH